MSKSGPDRVQSVFSRPKLALVLGAALILVLPLLVRDAYIQHMIIEVLWFGYIAACWNIISGYTRQVSLGHAVFVGVGAYTSVILYREAGISPWIGMLAGALVAALVSLLIGYPTLKLVGIYFVMATFGLVEIFRVLFSNIVDLGPINVGGVDGLTLPQRGNDLLAFQFLGKEYYYYIIVLMMAVIMYFTHWMEHSRLGFYLRAIKGDEDAAHSLGINVTRYKVMTFAISAAFAAVGGSFFAQFTLFIEPGRIFGWPLSFEMLLITMIGGRGTLWGPLLGTIILTPIQEIVRTTVGGGAFAGLHLLIWGILIIVIVFFMPKGISGLIQIGYRRLKSRLLSSAAAGVREEAQ
ncbi:MAG: branched-chain amino acid ABC transporter permease [Chloroflexota bacterium]